MLIGSLPSPGRQLRRMPFLFPITVYDLDEEILCIKVIEIYKDIQIFDIYNSIKLERLTCLCINQPGSFLSPPFS